MIKKILLVVLACTALSCGKVSFHGTDEEIPAPMPIIAADEILSISCNNGKSFLTVTGNGVLGYEFGSIIDNRSYLDIYDINFAESFLLPKECLEVLSAASVDFPKRIRFVIDRPLKEMFAYSKDNSVILSSENRQTSLHILKVRSEKDKLVQSIIVYTSSKIDPKIIGETGSGFTISLGKGVKPVSGIPAVMHFSGPAFTSMRIDDSGMETLLQFQSPTHMGDVDVYLEKTGYGFIIYAKKLR